MLRSLRALTRGTPAPSTHGGKNSYILNSGTSSEGLTEALPLWWKCGVCCDTESRTGPAEPNRSFDVGFTVGLAPKQPHCQVLS